VTDQSGLLDVNSVTNTAHGRWRPELRWTCFQTPGSGYAAGVFTNSGTINNGGTISARARPGRSSAERSRATRWPCRSAPNGGPRRGGQVRRERGKRQLVASSLRARRSPSWARSTLPGENYTARPRLGGTTVVNDGTIVVDAQGPRPPAGRRCKRWHYRQPRQPRGRGDHSSWPVECNNVALTTRSGGRLQTSPAFCRSTLFPMTAL